MLGVTGQRGKSAPSFLTPTIASLVKKEDLTNPNSVVNNKFLSGKQLGSTVLVQDEEDNFHLYVASGSEREDGWKSIMAVPSSFEVSMEYIDMVDVVVHPDSAASVRMEAGTKTILIQHPMWDTAGQLLYRNCLTVGASLTSLDSSNSYALAGYYFKINGILEQEQQYYNIDTLLCSISVGSAARALPAVMPIQKNAKTNKFVIAVDTVNANVKAFNLNMYIEWTSPTRLL